MAQDYRISGQTLTNWADTVRGRKGTTDPIPFAELDSEVQTSLQGPTLQDKTVTPSSEQQTITADEGYDGLGTVTVEAVPDVEKPRPSFESFLTSEYYNLIVSANYFEPGGILEESPAE